MESQETQDRDPGFDAFAENYDAALDQGLRLSGESKEFFADARVRHLRKRLQARSVEPANVLDFGCGTGSATPFLFETLGVTHLLGIDPSEKSLEVASREWTGFPAQFESTDREPAPLFDLAFCNGVFHHIPVEERDAAFGIIRNHLKPGGWFAFWENNPWNPVTRYAMSRVPFDDDAILVWPHQARKRLIRNGFEPVLTDFVFFFPKALSPLRKIEPLLRWIPLGAQYLILSRKMT